MLTHFRRRGTRSVLTTDWASGFPKQGPTRPDSVPSPHLRSSDFLCHRHGSPARCTRKHLKSGNAAFPTQVSMHFRFLPEFHCLGPHITSGEQSAVSCDSLPVNAVLTVTQCLSRNGRTLECTVLYRTREDFAS